MRELSVSDVVDELDITVDRKERFWSQAKTDFKGQTLF